MEVLKWVQSYRIGSQIICIMEGINKMKWRDFHEEIYH